MAEDFWLNTQEATTLLGLRANTLAVWRSRRIGPPYFDINPTAGKARVRYRLSDLEAWQRQTAEKTRAEMAPARFVLSDLQWRKARQVVHDRADYLRPFVNLVLWCAANGADWDAIPAGDGNWEEIRKMMRNWIIQGTWYRLFEALESELDFPFRYTWSVHIVPVKDGARRGRGVVLGGGDVVRRETTPKRLYGRTSIQNVRRAGKDSANWFLAYARDAEAVVGGLTAANFNLADHP